MRMHIRVFLAVKKVSDWMIVFDLGERLGYIINWRTINGDLKYNVRI